MAEQLPTKIDYGSFVPYYIQLKEQLKGQIDLGHYGPGDLLPSESDFCRTLAVSRTVVRQALQALEYDGLIYRRRGKGSFVAEPKVHERMAQRLTGFYQDMVEQGHTVMNRVLRQERLPAGADAGKYLELDVNTQVILCERVRMVDGKPVNFSVSYVPYAACPALLVEDLREQSLYAFIEQACGQRIVRGRRTIETNLPTRQIADLLEMDGHMPVFKITSTCYFANGAPIEHSRGYHRGDRSLFEVELLREAETSVGERSVNRRQDLPKSYTLIR